MSDLICTPTESKAQPVKFPAEFIKIFWSRIAITDGCWEWTRGTTNRSGQPDDELLGRMARRPALMINCMQSAGVGAAARALARSLFRTARELEHRGYSMAMILDHQRRITKEDMDSFMCSDSAV